MLHYTLSQLDDRNSLQEEDGTATMKVFESTSRSEETPCGQVLTVLISLHYASIGCNAKYNHPFSFFSRFEQTSLSKFPFSTSVA
jgi:hypothetical protein